MRPHGISQNRLARDIDVNPARINDIVHGRSAITAAIALRLGKYFGTTPELAQSAKRLRPAPRARERLAKSGAARARFCGGVAVSFTTTVHVPVRWSSPRLSSW